MPCTDCGFVPFDHYMVWDELWAKAGLDPREICCLECLERRFGRPLGIDDFPPLPVNRLAYAAAGKLAVELEEERREEERKKARLEAFLAGQRIPRAPSRTRRSGIGGNGDRACS